MVFDHSNFPYPSLFNNKGNLSNNHNNSSIVYLSTNSNSAAASVLNNYGDSPATSSSGLLATPRFVHFPATEQISSPNLSTHHFDTSSSSTRCALPNHFNAEPTVTSDPDHNNNATEPVTTNPQHTFTVAAPAAPSLYPMVIRSQKGIHKPKLPFTATATAVKEPTVPTSISEALKKILIGSKQ